MNKSEIETLNIVQQVLKGLMLTLAAENKADRGKIGSLLEAYASNEGLDPMARAMILDLASGVIAMHAAGARKQ